MNWGFSCLDTAVHMAEEIQQPERMIPIAICGTVAIGFVTSWFFIISMMFSLNNFDAITSTFTGVPILELFYQALQNKAGAIVLEVLVMLTGLGCLLACHTWQSRLCWSFSRDRGIPGHKYWAKIHPTLDVPLNAHILSCTIVAVLGCLYLGSYTAFNRYVALQVSSGVVMLIYCSMVTGCIVLPYISYMIPIICLLIRGRSKIRPGPFWLGKFGLFSNYVTIAWTIFCVVMYSFPTYMPVLASGMSSLRIDASY